MLSQISESLVFYLVPLVVLVLVYSRVGLLLWRGPGGLPTSPSSEEGGLKPALKPTTSGGQGLLRPTGSMRPQNRPQGRQTGKKLSIQV